MSRRFLAVKPRFWVLLFTALGLVMTGLYATQQGYIDRQNTAIAELEATRDALIATNDSIQAQVDFTYTDTFIEREARSKLGLVREDETLYQSPDTVGED